LFVVERDIVRVTSSRAARIGAQVRTRPDTTSDAVSDTASAPASARFARARSEYHSQCFRTISYRLPKHHSPTVHICRAQTSTRHRSSVASGRRNINRRMGIRGLPRDVRDSSQRRAKRLRVDNDDLRVAGCLRRPRRTVGRRTGDPETVFRRRGRAVWIVTVMLAV